MGLDQSELELGWSLGGIRARIGFGIGAIVGGAYTYDKANQHR